MANVYHKNLTGTDLHVPASHNNTYHSTAYAAVSDVSTSIVTHEGLTTGVHGVGAGTIAKTTDITASAVGLSNVTNTIQISQAIGTAKGNIISFSAAETPVVLAVGSTNQILTADSTQSSGLKWQENDNIQLLTADQFTMSLNYVDVPGMSIVVQPNKSYFIEYVLNVASSATTTGVCLALNGPAGATFSAIAYGCSAVTTWMGKTMRAYNLAGSFTAQVAGTTLTKMEAFLMNGADAGTFDLRFASEITVSTVVIRNGSFIRYRLLN